MTKPQRKKLASSVEALSESVIRLMAPLSLDAVCRKSVAEACALLDAEYGSIFWAEDDKLRRIYTNIPESKQLEPRPKGNTMEVFSSRQPKFLSQDILKKTHPHIIEKGINSISLIPLAYADKPLGVMALQSSEEIDFITKDPDKVKLFGSLVSLAIRNVQLYEQKKEALNQRDLFMSLASHELKTPIAVIIMTMHLIERRHQKQKEIDPAWYETIMRNAKKLKGLIDDLFSASQLHAGNIHLRPRTFSLKEQLTKLINEFKMMYGHSFILEAELDHSDIRADQERISQVFSNLLSNAAKYSSADSTVKITLKPKWSGYLVQIADQGVGISKKDQTEVFDRYFQGKNKGNGLGLGLFLAREIIEAHEGEITLVSKLGQGTTVSVWLPAV